MKNLCVLAALLWGMAWQPAFAGGDKIKGNGNVVSQERSLGSYDKIEIAGPIDLYITQDDQESASVKTDENLQDVILTEVRNGKLMIRVRKGVEIRATELEVHVHCKKLTAIAAAGSGDIETRSSLHGDALSISQSGSGDFELALDVEKLEISAAGSGDFELKGHVESMELSLAGSGDVEADDLACGHAKVSIAGSCDVKLKKGTSARVSIAGSGDVSYN
jgi:hypothetical protein